MSVDVDMGADGAGAVTVTAVADPELLARAPDALEELRLDDVRAAGWSVEGPTTGEDGSASLVLRKPFRTPEEATAVLAELNGPGGPLHGVTVTQAREFARTTTSLTGTARLDGGAGAFADEALVGLAGAVPFADEAGADPGASIGLTVRLRAPGTVVETTGGADGSTVTWEPTLAAGASTELQAVLEQRDRTAERARSWERFAGTARWVWLVLVAALAAVVAVLLARRRHT